MRVDINLLKDRIAANPGSSLVFYDVADGRTALSFSDLGAKIDERRVLLRRLGISERRRVGLHGANSLDWMIWDLALLVEGHAPVVFSEDHFTQDPAELAVKYDCALVVSDLASGDGVIPMDLDLDDCAAVSVRDATPVAEPDLLTMVFSSGTTGRLKGLSMSKSGLDHILTQFTDAFDVTENDCFFSFLPFSYFQQRALYLSAFFAGADIVICPPQSALKVMAAEQPTFTVNPPVFYEMLFNFKRSLAMAGKPKSLNEITGGRISWMITAMAPIKRSVLDAFWSDGVRLFETFGVTETGMVAWNTPAAYKVGTVGKPADDGEFIVSDAGEVSIRREKPLALGYFDTASEDVKATFRPDGSVATGDIVDVDADGFVTIVGRTKSAIVTPEGKKFHPEILEKRLLEAADAQGICDIDLVVVGGVELGGNFIIVAPANDAAMAAFCSDALAPRVIATIRTVNADGQPYTRIQKAFFIEEPFSFENRMRTRNLKLDRAVATQRAGQLNNEGSGHVV